MSHQVYYCYPIAYKTGQFGGGGVDDVDDDFGAWDGDDGFIAAAFPAIDTTWRAIYYLSKFIPFATAIHGVTVGIMARGRRRTAAPEDGINGGTVLDLEDLGGSRVEGLEQFFSTDAYIEAATEYLLNPQTGVAWQPGEMPSGLASGLAAGIYGYDANIPLGDLRCTGIWLAVEYEGLGAQDDQARDIGSRRQWDLNVAKGLASITVPKHLGLEVSVGDPCAVEHIAGLHPTDEGWRDRIWELRSFIAYERALDSVAGTVTFQLRDRRSHFCLHRDTMWSPRSASAQGVGISRFGTGARATYARTGDAWILDPGSLAFVRKITDEHLWTDGGELYVDAETNLIVQSAFKNFVDPNFSGWTRAVSGSSTITEDLSNLLWDAEATGVTRSARFETGSPVHASDLSLTMSAATASIPANSKLRMLAWHEDSGGALAMKVQRGFDSNYWRESDQSWQAGVQWNAMPVIESIDDLWDHYGSKEIDVGANATTLTAGFGVPTTGVPGQVNNLYAVKLCVGANRNPLPILTEAAAVTVSASRHKLPNTAVQRVVYEMRGALAFEALAFWDSADIGNTNRTLYHYSNDDGSTPFWTLRYNGTSDRWELEISAGGSTVAAFLAGSVTRGAVNKVVVRWCGSNGELDLPAYTASIIVNGVKGTDAVIPAAAREVLLGTLERGNKNGAEYWNGLIRMMGSFQYVPNDVECARLTD